VAGRDLRLQLTSSNLVIHETTGPEVIVAEFDYRGRVTTTTRTFRVANIIMRRVRDGKIVGSRDYHNQTVIRERWAGWPRHSAHNCRVLLDGGFPFYAAPLGILLLDARFPRPPGDIAYAETFDFPVVYRVVKQATPKRVVEEDAAGLVEAFCTAAQELEADGVRAICTSCGFLALHQPALASAVGVPVSSCRSGMPSVSCAGFTARCDSADGRDRDTRAVGGGPDDVPYDGPTLARRPRNSRTPDPGTDVQ
jgi:hypothetical protein